MEFEENGAVVKPQRGTGENNYSPQVSAHGYADGPRSLKDLYNAMRLSMWGFIASGIVFLFVLAGYLLFADYLPIFMMPQSEANLDVLTFVGLVWGLSSVVAFFFACRFTYRAMRNLHTINSPAAKVSPGWAVGYYFVPFANLVMPANAMSQIYHGTHESIGEKSRHASPIPLWWTCWLLSNVPETIADSSGATGVTAFMFYLASGILTLIASISLIRMGRIIADKQELLKHGGVAHVFD